MCPGSSSCSSRALGHTGSVVVAHGISCSTARGIFPDQGSNSHLLLRQADSLPLSHQGSPHHGFLVLRVWSVTRTTRTARDHLDISVFFLPLPLCFSSSSSPCGQLRIPHSVAYPLEQGQWLLHLCLPHSSPTQATRCVSPRLSHGSDVGLSFQTQFNSVQFSRSVVSCSLRPHESQHARPPCPSPIPRVHPNPCPLSQ